MASPSKPFNVPERAETYVRDVVQRSEDLIQMGIWGGIEIPRLRAWLSNFAAPAEKYFAARVLDALIYRSDAQTKALMVHLLQRTLPDLTRSQPFPMGVVEDWKERLASLRDDPGMRIVPVIQRADPPTKSGPLVCRLMKRHLGLNEKWMIWPQDMAREHRRGIGTFLFVDDFLGTGYQFRKFFQSIPGAEVLSRSCLVYAPLVAHQRGMDRLHSKLPFLRVATVEPLDDSYCLFSDKSSHFDDGENTPEAARLFYLGFLARRGMDNLGRFALGYSGLSLALAFDHATPNASLPILWLPHASLTPLLSR